METRLSLRETKAKFSPFHNPLFCSAYKDDFIVCICRNNRFIVNIQSNHLLIFPFNNTLSGGELEREDSLESFPEMNHSLNYSGKKQKQKQKLRIALVGIQAVSQKQRQ